MPQVGCSINRRTARDVRFPSRMTCQRLVSSSHSLTAQLCATQSATWLPVPPLSPLPPFHSLFKEGTRPVGGSIRKQKAKWGRAREQPDHNYTLIRHLEKKRAKQRRLLNFSSDNLGLKNNPCTCSGCPMLRVMLMKMIQVIRTIITGAAIRRTESLAAGDAAPTYTSDC